MRDRRRRRPSRSRDDARGQRRDYTWSPKGACLAFSLTDANGYALASTSGAPRTGKLHRVTDELFNEYAARPGTPRASTSTTSPTGEFAPQISRLEWNYAAQPHDGHLRAGAAKDVQEPVPARRPTRSRSGDKKDEAEATRRSQGRRRRRPRRRTRRRPSRRRRRRPFRIDFDGLGARVDARAGRGRQLPRPRGDQGSASSTCARRRRFYGREPDARSRRSYFYSLKDRKETTLAEDVDGYAVSRRRQQGAGPRRTTAYSLYDAKAERARTRRPSRPGLMVDRVPAEEWAEIFDEVWRRYRDYFYVQNMHGYDWKALGEHYEPLLPYVAHRCRPELRARRDGRRAQHRPRLHRGRRLRDPAAAAGGAARRALRARRGGRALPHRARSSAARTRRSAYRSPLTEVGVDAQRRRLRAGDRRRGAARATTTPTGCCATRPTAGRR